MAFGFNMKLLSLSVVFLLFVVDMSTANTQEERFGVKSDSTISVQITGTGVRFPGKYFIEIGASLQDLLANDKAVLLRWSNGTFRISRLKKGQRTHIAVGRDNINMKLSDEDIIYAPGMDIGKSAEQGAAANP